MACDGSLAGEGLCTVEPKSLKLAQRSSELYCHLSINTILSLGIVTDKTIAQRTQWSLFGSMEQFIKTKQGRRLLRASLLQPLTSVPTITERYNAIAELLSSDITQSTVQHFLAAVPRDVHNCLPAPPRSAPRGASEKASLSAASAFIQAVLRLRSLLVDVMVRFAPSVPRCRCVALAVRNLTGIAHLLAHKMHTDVALPSSNSASSASAGAW